MSSLQDLLVGDLEARNLFSEQRPQAAEQSNAQLDLGFVEKMAQAVEGVLSTLSPQQTPADATEAVDGKAYLLSKIASVRASAAATATSGQDAETARANVMQKLAHLAPETGVTAPQPTPTTAGEQKPDMKAKLEGWVSKIKEASAKPAPVKSPASVKSVLDLLKGGTDGQ